MTVILLIAAVISFVTAYISGESTADTYIILAIVVLNSIIGVVQESRAEKALHALEKMTSPHACVLRDGIKAEIPKEDIVPGDIIIINKGDFVAADAYLIESVSLTADESPLTGESMPVEKSTSVSQKDAHITEIKNIVRAGTAICTGHGKAIAFATGMDSYMGHIAGMISKTEAQKTPLQIRLGKISGMLGNAALIICALIFVISLIKGFEPLEMFLTSVSLAVAAIPEGLPAIVTIILSIGVKQMADKKAVIKHLNAVETLGSAAIICSDKTGTLTQNKMTVTDYFGKKDTLAVLALLCNNNDSPTENALFNWGIKQGASIDGYVKIKEIPFDSDKKYMLTLHKKGNEYIAVKKGAPEKILPANSEAAKKATEYGKKAMRVIGFAYCKCGAGASLEGLSYTPVGICGIFDPPRPEVKAAVKKCLRAGIRPVMITGDHPATATAVAKEIGILREGDTVCTESELKGLDTKAISDKIKNCTVFARTTPEFKVKIVEAYKYSGYVVAMTGDGVNDAPALKRADIGCAMGCTGTDVAKEAADIILTDDNFSTIIEAVRYGRGIYDNIRKAVRFLLSCNIGEILTVFVSLLLSLPSPLSAIQLLWVNLVTDSLPAVALGMESVSDEVMQRKPIHKNSGLFYGGLGKNIAAEGIIIGLTAISAYILGLKSGEQAVASTMCFGVLAFSQLFHAFNMRSDKPFFASEQKFFSALTPAVLVCISLQLCIMLVPSAAVFFGVVPLTVNQWATVGLLSASPIPICEISKIIKNKK